MIKAAGGGGFVVDARKSEHASASCSPTVEPPQRQIIRKEPPEKTACSPPDGAPAWMPYRHGNPEKALKPPRYKHTYLTTERFLRLRLRLNPTTWMRSDSRGHRGGAGLPASSWRGKEGRSV